MNRFAEALKVAKDGLCYLFGGLNKSNHQDCGDSPILGLLHAQDRVISDLAK